MFKLLREKTNFSSSEDDRIESGPEGDLSDNDLERQSEEEIDSELEDLNQLLSDCVSPGGSGGNGVANDSDTDHEADDLDEGGAGEGVQVVSDDPPRGDWEFLSPNVGPDHNLDRDSVLSLKIVCYFLIKFFGKFGSLNQSICTAGKGPC